MKQATRTAIKMAIKLDKTITLDEKRLLKWAISDGSKQRNLLSTKKALEMLGGDYDESDFWYLENRGVLHPIFLNNQIFWCRSEIEDLFPSIKDAA